MATGPFPFQISRVQQNALADRIVGQKLVVTDFHWMSGPLAEIRHTRTESWFSIGQTSNNKF